MPRKNIDFHKIPTRRARDLADKLLSDPMAEPNPRHDLSETDPELKETPVIDLSQFDLEQFKGLRPHTRRAIIRAFNDHGANAADVSRIFGLSLGRARAELATVRRGENLDPATRREFRDMIVRGYVSNAHLLKDACAAAISQIQERAKPDPNCPLCHGAGRVPVTSQEAGVIVLTIRAGQHYTTLVKPALFTLNPHTLALTASPLVAASSPVLPDGRGGRVASCAFGAALGCAGVAIPACAILTPLGCALFVAVCVGIGVLLCLLAES